ncbi:fungal protein [Schizosaccharomyces japonicus yFS275]|uniref:Fungal protein n=1 Tax=Schizosaccharomyces japonicus (strain yFS275 / FY16936) TaxID=402676 RepID=B6JY41_SCHJY|nr:fungal protein [Schizosaccharomyces japonicus yFS275]EEB06459.1 fungal protein [Schizosaccharomyces japonicus yFS275]
MPLTVENAKQLIDDFMLRDATFMLVNYNEPQVDKIYILDSSFNPPQNAHLSMCKLVPKDAQLLLLLSVKNADKKAVPASFAERLVMMEAMALDLQEARPIIGLCKHALFADKAEAIHNSLHTASQSYLLGFDTLVRLLDPKYYEPQGIEQALGHFFASTKVMCVARPDVSSGLSEQEEYMRSIAKGDMKGIPAQWASRITFATLRNGGEGVSSTAVRKAIKEKNDELVKSLVPPAVYQVLKELRPY